MAGSFWSDSSVEPKRQFRWVFGLSNHIPLWVVKSVDKPVATVGAQEHKFFGHTYKYPGNVTWNDINITLVDPVQPDSVNILATILRQSGYNPPVAAPQGVGVETISKKKSTNTLGEVYIKQVDAQGKPIEVWRLTNPIVKSADFGGSLSYENEGLIEVKMTLAYDWAQLSTVNQGSRHTANGISPTRKYWVVGNLS